MGKLCLLVLITVLIPQISWAQLPQSSITGSRVHCTNGMAANHACNNIDLLARVSETELDPNSQRGNDIWGWIDPDTKREYALVGMTKSVVFVDVTDPVNPVHLGRLPTHDPTYEFLWRDMKVYKDHMYVVVDGDGGMQVFDLRQLRSAPRTPKDWDETAYYDGGIILAHNLAINEETGFAYLAGYALSRESDDLGACKNYESQLGLHIVDIRDPVNPVYAGCFSDRPYVSTGRGYTHDTQCVLYRGPDAKYKGREICVSSNETHISITDVTDKSNPKMVGAATYPDVAYAHQGWLTEDHRYFLMNDEKDESNYLVEKTRTIIWDLDELEDPVYHSSFFFPTRSTDHNLYVHGDYMYAANYKTGLRIVNISNINEPEEIAFFDTHPNSDSHGTDAGAWSSFRFPKSGTTIVNSHPDGLLILDPTSVPTNLETSAKAVPETFSLSPAYPNPFNPITSTMLSLPKQTSIRAEVLDMLGRSIHTIRDGVLPAGDHLLTFDARQLPSGSYYIRVQAGHHTTGIKVVLIK